MTRLDIREVRTCVSCRHFLPTGPRTYPSMDWYCTLLLTDGDYTRITDAGIWDGEFPEWCPLPVKP